MRSVILFVRMWVEMESAERYDRLYRSSSSWGCELKCMYLPEDSCILPCHPLREDVSWNATFHVLHHPRWSHPLREDVSWNLKPATIPLTKLVILFVRMWVEMFSIHSYTNLKAVILFVRMWVEIYFECARCKEIESSSSWGCELKYLVKCWG